MKSKKFNAAPAAAWVGTDDIIDVIGV